MKLCPVAGIIILAVSAGCIATDIQEGDVGQYEFPGINDTTIYYLNGTSVKVVDSVVNETTVKFMLDDSSDMSIKDPVAVNYSGDNVIFNVTSEPIFGRSFIRFDFASRFSGFVAFTQSDGQDFMRMTRENMSVRVVLPPGHTTGSRFLGIPTPEPDNITTDSLGRQVLIWDNPYPFQISVKYYRKNAPTLLSYFFIIIFICTTVVSGYYYLTFRSLKRKRAVIEKISKEISKRKSGKLK